MPALAFDQNISDSSQIDILNVLNCALPRIKRPPFSHICSPSQRCVAATKGVQASSLLKVKRNIISFNKMSGYVIESMTSQRCLTETKRVQVSSLLKSNATSSFNKKCGLVIESMNIPSTEMS